MQPSARDPKACPIFGALVPGALLGRDSDKLDELQSFVATSDNGIFLKGCGADRLLPDLEV